MWAGVGMLGSTVEDLARVQFATTSLEGLELVDEVVVLDGAKPKGETR